MRVNSFQSSCITLWLHSDDYFQHHSLSFLFLARLPITPLPLPTLPQSACHTPCDDPLKHDCQMTTVPGRATQSCEILSVWGLLSQITCPLDVVWTRMTHGLRNTAASTMCKCEENMVCEVWDRGGGGGREECVRMCVYVCVFIGEYTMCRGGIRWSTSHLVIEEAYSIMKQ